jgi:hypothetical protein
MAAICTWCKSASTVAGFDQFQCLDCGRVSTYEGERTVTTSEANEGIEVSDLPEVTS